MIRSYPVKISAKTAQLPFLLILALTGLTGFAIIAYSTVWGAGLIDDSFLYLTSAENLAAGRGLTWPWGSGELLPMTYFPPMFPLVLAFFAKLGVEPLAAARWINAFAFGANILLAGLLSLQATRSRGFALLAVGLLLASDVLIEVHAWALSEPLYLLFSLSGLYLLGQYIHHSRRWMLLGAGALVALAFLTRYIGFSLVLTGAVALSLNPRFSWRGKLRDLVQFVGLSLLPMAGWLVRNALAGSGLDRSAGSHLVTLNQIQKGLNTLFIWFLPGRLVHDREFILLGMILVGISLAGVLLAGRAASQGSIRLNFAFKPGIRLVLALQVVFHLAVLLVSKSFFEPLTPLNNRILAPILPSLLILISSLLAGLWRSRQVSIRLAVLAVSLLFIGFYVYRASELVPRLHNQGLGFARKGWHNSQTLEAVRSLPEIPLFSNSPAAVYMWTGKPAYPIFDLDLMRQRMQADRAVLVLFNSVSVSLYDVTKEELIQGLTPVTEYKDGAIYQQTVD